MAETTETEPAPTAESPPPSTGWVPQGAGSEGSSGGAAPQQGSSLGSGGSSDSSSNEEAATSNPPAPSAPPPEPAPSSSYETEAPVEPAPQEPEAVSTPAPEPEASPKPAPAPPAPADPPAKHSGAGTKLQGSGGVKGVSTSSADASSVAGTAARVAPDSSGLPWLALIVFGLILVVAGARLVFGPFEADSLRYSRCRLLRRAAPRP